MNLYPFQKKALNATDSLNRCAYYLDMGLGKTFVGSEKMKRLGAKVNLVICQKSKIQDWMNHFKTHYDVTPFDLTNRCDFEWFFDRPWKGVFDEPEPTKIGIINYELAFRRKELKKLNDFTLLLDESSLIQNEKAQRTKFILNLNCKNVILLSGTPTSGKYENLWSQIHLLGWGISNKLYNSQYVNWVKQEVGEMSFWVVDKDNPYKNVDRLKSKLREHGAYFLKTEECFDMPEQNFIPVSVSTTKQYRQFAKSGYVQFDEVELIGDSTLAKRLYMRMLCGQYNADKLNACSELLESTNERVIIFYNFNEELSRLKVLVESLNRPLSEVNGKRKDLTAYEEQSNSVTLVQYQAGSMGLNLQKAHIIIYFTLTDKSELFEQSKKRIHRIGQKNVCFYYMLMCERSIEYAILESLNQRKDFTDELFKEWSEGNAKV